MGDYQNTKIDEDGFIKKSLDSTFSPPPWLNPEQPVTPQPQPQPEPSNEGGSQGQENSSNTTGQDEK